MAIDGFADDVTLVSIEWRPRCEKCGTLGKAEVRPDWTEITSRPASGAIGWITPSVGKSGDQ
jgi:hypothetical protein